MNEHICRNIDDLWQVFNTVKMILIEEKALSSEFFSYLHTGGIPYGTNWSSSFKLNRHRGRFTSESVHVSVDRSNSGLYNLTVNLPL